MKTNGKRSYYMYKNALLFDGLSVDHYVLKKNNDNFKCYSDFNLKFGIHITFHQNQNFIVTLSKY